MKGYHFLTIFLFFIIFSINQDPFLNERQESAYIGMDFGARLFYWLFRSRDYNENSPLIFYLAGPAGCSEMPAILEENGPFRIDNHTGQPFLTSNLYSWNAIADVLYIEQPIGTSYSDTRVINQIPTNESWLVEDLHTFFIKFFIRYPEYEGRDFYIAGTDFGVHYAISLAYFMEKSSYQDFHLKGLLLESGYFRFDTQITFLPEFAKDAKISTPFKRFSATISVIASGVFDFLGMHSYAFMMYDLAMIALLGATKTLNPYDIRKPCCYDYNHIGKFLNLPDIMKAMHVTNQWTQECNFTTFQRMEKDIYADFSKKLASLLDEYNLKVYIYNGNMDMMTSTEGLLHFLDLLKWSQEFQWDLSQFKPFYANGVEKGIYKSYKNLFYMLTYNSGHRVSYDEPDVTFELLSRILYG